MNNLNPIIVELLNKRGIYDESEMQEFLSDKPKQTFDPFLLHNMREGVDLLIEHIKKDSKICIYGDYDADGITSVAVLIQALSILTTNIFYYIPSRFSEGYGLNMSAIKKIAEQGTNLLLTVDCGSVSSDEVAFAKELGLDVIVTDHHSVTDKIAEGIVINPKQPACKYPFKHLAGVGIAFKLVQALCHEGLLPKSVMTQSLDLVAIGTIGDIVPLVGENRTIVKFGMRELNRTQRKGLCTLIERVSLHRGKIKSDNVAFVLVPHLNATGRIDDARISCELLLCDDSQKADELAEALVEANKKRKKFQEETLDKCMELVEGESNILLLQPENAHEGITGIVAGKLKEDFYRPAIIVTSSGEQGEYLKGTGRSIDGLSLYELLKTYEHLFERFGGHAGACGFLMKKENLEQLESGLNKSVLEKLNDNPKLFERPSKAEMCLELSNATFELADQLEALSPFGFSNKRPIFEFSQVYAQRVFFLDEKKKHARFEICDGENTLQGIFFNKASEYKEVLFSGKPLNVQGTLEISEWNGRQRLQIIVEEIAIDE